MDAPYAGSGCKYRVKVLEGDLTIRAIDGAAHIMQGELQNTYDRCFSTPCSHKP